MRAESDVVQVGSPPTAIIIDGARDALIRPGLDPCPPHDASACRTDLMRTSSAAGRLEDGMKGSPGYDHESS